MRRTLLAGTAAVILVLAPTQAQADALSDIADAVTKAQEGDLEGLVFQLLGYFGIYGRSVCSYLGRGYGCWPTLFPDDPGYVTVDDAAWYADRRLEDRKERTREAMDVASTIVLQQPLNAAKLTGLQAANGDPVSLFAAIQIGNAIEVENTAALHKQNGLLAELGQLEADQRLAEDWHRVQSARWAEAHHPNVDWNDSKTWEVNQLSHAGF